MPRKPKNQRLNIYLLKENVGIGDVLTEECKNLKSFPLIDTLPFLERSGSRLQRLIRQVGSLLFSLEPKTQLRDY